MTVVKSVFALLSIILVAPLSIVFVAPLRADERIAGHWEGEIALPAGALQVMVDLELGEGGWRGEIDIPMQGARDLALREVSVSEEQIRFAIAGIPGNPTFAGRLDAGEIRGDFTQGGATLSFRLGRDTVKLPERPQEPKPPFPYDQEEVAYQSGDVHLAGTLTLPKGRGPYPAVLLVSGSGPQDRNEEIFGHKPFLVLADQLTRAGLVVLRVDDRGVGGSSGDTASTTSEELAEDALAGVRFLRAHPRVHPARAGIAGHSEGGLIGPLAASRSEDVAFLVLLAGPGLPGRQILERQLEALGAAAGIPTATLAKQQELQRQALELLEGSLEPAEQEARLREIVRQQLEIAPPGLRPKTPEDLEAAVEQTAAASQNRWMRFFVGYDPRPALRKVKVPVLALCGELDLQVDAQQNLPEIASALTAGGNRDVTTQAMPGLNHLFQHARTGGVDEYGSIEETMSPEVLELITAWILERFGGA